MSLSNRSVARNFLEKTLMSVRLWSAAGAAIALAIAAACSNPSPTAPVAPASAAVDDAEAAADGSTLKVTAPGAQSPARNAELDSPEPVFSVTNSQVKFGGALSLEYRFDIQTAGGQQVTNSPKVAAGDDRTSWEIPNLLDEGSYQWRARAEMGNRFGPWTEFIPFKITAPPSILPPGPYPTDGDGIAAFVQRAYPDKGRRGQSLQARKDDMAFLRDRMIEIRLCTGQDTARNLKRGGPELSVDFLAARIGGKWWGVDIAGGYDDTGQQLVLSWSEHAPRAFPSALPNPERCRN
jgi:hypothetical protein